MKRAFIKRRTGKTVQPAIIGFLDLYYITKQGGRTAALFVSANAAKKPFHNMQKDNVQ
jgi:hypothetical protein